MKVSSCYEDYVVALGRMQSSARVAGPSREGIPPPSGVDEVAGTRSTSWIACDRGASGPLHSIAARYEPTNVEASAGRRAAVGAGSLRDLELYLPDGRHRTRAARSAPCLERGHAPRLSDPAIARGWRRRAAASTMPFLAFRRPARASHGWSPAVHSLFPRGPRAIVRTVLLATARGAVAVPFDVVVSKILPFAITLQRGTSSRSYAAFGRVRRRRGGGPGRRRERREPHSRPQRGGGRRLGRRPRRREPLERRRRRRGGGLAPQDPRPKKKDVQVALSKINYPDGWPGASGIVGTSLRRSPTLKIASYCATT